jgi:hypothetical protein
MRRLSFILPLLTLSAAIADAPMVPYEFADAHCAISLPKDGWQRDAEREKSDPKLLMLAGRIDGSSVALLAQESKSIVPMRSPEVLEQLTEQLKNQYELRKIGYGRIGGIDAVEAFARTSDSMRIYSVTTMANQRTYTIIAGKINAEPMEDAQIRSIVESFRFRGKLVYVRFDTVDAKK